MSFFHDPVLPNFRRHCKPNCRMTPCISDEAEFAQERVFGKRSHEHESLHQCRLRLQRSSESETAPAKLKGTVWGSWKDYPGSLNERARAT